MKRLVILAYPPPPPSWMGYLSVDRKVTPPLPQHNNQRYPLIHLGEDRQCGSKVSSPRKYDDGGITRLKSRRRSPTRYSPDHRPYRASTQNSTYTCIYTSNQRQVRENTWSYDRFYFVLVLHIQLGKWRKPSEDFWSQSVAVQNRNTVNYVLHSTENNCIWS